MALNGTCAPPPLEITGPVSLCGGEGMNAAESTSLLCLSLSESPERTARRVYLTQPPRGPPGRGSQQGVSGTTPPSPVEWSEPLLFH